mgnify:CR=1 FL=1
METNINNTEKIVDDNKHCSYCKYYYCYNASMYCSHPTKCHKITAARKHGCKYFELNERRF